MKNLTSILVLVFALFSYKAKAQNNLSFSRVILITSSDTVPVGKVWKIESVGRQRNQSSPTTFQPNSITINNSEIEFNPLYTNFYGSAVNSSQSAAIGIGTSLPLWVPASSIVSVGAYTKLISVIEYSIVQ